LIVGDGWFICPLSDGSQIIEIFKKAVVLLDWQNYGRLFAG